MKFFLAPIIALGLAASTALAQTQLMVNTPDDVVACEVTLLTWVGGTPPYILTYTAGGSTFSFNQTFATSVSWYVDLAPNTQVDLTIKDNTGTTAQSAIFSVASGPIGCVAGTTTSYSFGSATATVSVASAGTSGSSPVTTTPASSPNTATGSSASGPAFSISKASSTTSSPSAKSAGASRVTGQFAAAGIIGAAMVALLG